MEEMMTVNVRVENDQLITDSRNVAAVFGKQHGHILRDIQNIQKDVSNFGEMFFESTMPDSYGRQQRVYLMNRDGFTLLAMGFTGKDAMQWKLKYIDAFNRLEKAWNSPEAVMARALQYANNKLMAVTQQNKELSERVTQQQEHISLLEPKADYYDGVLESKNTIDVTTIAKDYGLSAQVMNRILHKLGIIFKSSGTWHMYQTYVDQGYGDTKTGSTRYGNSYVHLYWTQAGRKFIYDKLKEHDIHPLSKLNGGNNSNNAMVIANKSNRRRSGGTENGQNWSQMFLSEIMTAIESGKYTVESISKKIGVSVSTLNSKIEKYKANPNLFAY